MSRCKYVFSIVGSLPLTKKSIQFLYPIQFLVLNLLMEFSCLYVIFILVKYSCCIWELLSINVPRNRATRCFCLLYLLVPEANYIGRLYYTSCNTKYFSSIKTHYIDTDYLRVYSHTVMRRIYCKNISRNSFFLILSL